MNQSNRPRTTVSWSCNPNAVESTEGWEESIPGDWHLRPMKRLVYNVVEKGDADTLPFVALENIESGTGRSLPEFQWDERESAPYATFGVGDVLFGKLRPYLRKSLYTDREGCCPTELLVLRPGDPDSCQSRFIFYLVQSSPFVAMTKATSYGTKMPRTSWEKLGPEPFWLPSLEEQQAIVTFLNHETARIDEMIAKKQRLIELLEEKRTSSIENAISGDHEHRLVKLGRCVDLLPGFAFKSDEFSHNQDDIRLLRGINVSSGSIRWDDTVYWSKSDASRFSSYQLRLGDVVLGMDRPWVGKGMRVAQIANDDVPSLLLQRVARIRSKHNLNQEYLRFILCSPQFLAYFEPIMTGVSVPHISPEQILSFRFHLPPIDVQNSISQQLTDMDRESRKLMYGLAQSVELLRERRTALISSAVTGKIDVRDS